MMLSRRLGLIALASSLAAACTPARVFNTITPGDPALKLVDGVSFGEGPRLKLDVYGPTDRPTNAPVAIFIYGGGWNSGARTEYAWAGKAMASQGFVTVVPDYRLTDEVTFPAFVEDVALAVKWTVDNIAAQGGDPRRIVLIGHSAGAYNAAMVALDPRYLKAVGVERSRIKAFAGATDDRIYQTIDYAGPQSPASFLVAGSADKTVRPRNTERLAEALKREGVEVESHIYPGLNHADVLLGLSRTFRGRSPVFADMTRFLKRQVGLG